MFELDAVRVFTEPLDQLGLVYMITGSVACTVYGEPRMTHDVDIVLALPAASAERLEAAFPADAFYCPPAEVLRVEAGRGRRGHFNLIHFDSGLKCDVYLHGADPLHAWAATRTRQIAVGGAHVRLAPPEYVIVRKLEYFREGGSEKHQRDIRGVLAAQGEALDEGSLREWIERRGLEREWAQVRGGA